MNEEEHIEQDLKTLQETISHTFREKALGKISHSEMVTQVDSILRLVDHFKSRLQEIASKYGDDSNEDEA